MKELIIKVFWGGLGDHLLYSPVPRLAKQIHGYDKVFISNHSDYRNLNTKKLVWEYNPFVDGFSDKDAPYANFSTVEKGKNLLDAIVDFFNFPDDGIRFREPELYYKPKIISELKDAVVYDPNYISSMKHPSSKVVNEYFKTNSITITHQMKCLFNNSSIGGLPEMTADSLEHFCDIIFSCRMLFCFVSGTATLASAIGKKAKVFFDEGTNSMFLHSKLNSYIKLTG